MSGRLDRAAAANEGGTILTVTHGGVSACIVKLALGIDPARRTPFAISNCSLTSMICSDNSFRFINTLNDTSHLEDMKSE